MVNPSPFLLPPPGAEGGRPNLTLSLTSSVHPRRERRNSLQADGSSTYVVMYVSILVVRSAIEERTRRDVFRMSLAGGRWMVLPFDPCDLQVVCSRTRTDGWDRRFQGRGSDVENINTSQVQICGVPSNAPTPVACSVSTSNSAYCRRHFSRGHAGRLRYLKEMAPNGHTTNGQILDREAGTSNKCPQIEFARRVASAIETGELLDDCTSAHRSEPLSCQRFRLWRAFFT